MGNKMEFVCALAMMLWGAWVWNPYWQTFRGAAAFSMMERIASEEEWGAAVFVAGIARAIAIAKGSIFARKVFALSGIFIWITLWLFYIFGDYTSTAVPVYLALAIMSTLTYIELVTPDATKP